MKEQTKMSETEIEQIESDIEWLATVKKRLGAIMKRTEFREKQIIGEWVFYSRRIRELRNELTQILTSN
jgi:hypothetical protein